MKKLIIASLVCLSAVATSFGQGQIVFKNNATYSGFTTNGSSIGQGTGLISVGGYTIAVFIGAAGASSNDLAFVGSTATVPIAGQFTSGNLTVSQVNPVSVQVRAWTTAPGVTINASTWASAASSAAYYGASPIISSVNISASPIYNLFKTGTADATAYFQSGVVLFPTVPEPSTIALGALGLVGAFMIRRRK